MERHFDFTAVGEISLDTIVLGVPPGGGGDGSKHRVQSIADLPGGQAATAAVACRRLGWRSRWVGTVGDDDPGNRCLSALSLEDVDAHAVTRAGVPSRRAVIHVTASGDRTVMESRDRRLDLTPGGIPHAVFTSTRVLLVDATDPRHSLHAARIARAAGVLTMIDVDYVWPGLTELLREIDIVVMPSSIVEQAAGTPGLGSALAEIAKATAAQAVIVTLGVDGALAWADGREIRAAGVAGSEVVDTTGAGDAFRAGLAASWLGRATTKPAWGDLLADANLVASLACRRIGAQTSLPLALEVPARLRGPARPV